MVNVHKTKYNKLHAPSILFATKFFFILKWIYCLFDVAPGENMNGKFLVTRSSMKLSLIFVAIHVLNALMVVSSANNEYTQFSGELNERTNTSGSSLQYKHVENIMEYVNQLCVELITCRFAQCSQVNSLTDVSLLQIFNKESMQSNSESIRIPQNTLPIKSKSPYNKTPSVSTFPSTSTIYATFYKLTFKTISYRSNGKKMFIKKKNVFMKKKCIFTYGKRYTLANGEVEVMMTPPSNEMCKQCQLETSVRFETLFATNCSWHYTGADSENNPHNISPSKCLSSTCTISLAMSQVLAKSAILPRLCNGVVALLSGIWTDGDGNFDTLSDQQLLAQVVAESPSMLSNCSFDALKAIEALLAQISDMD
ncbi:hypothetical protein RFI_24809, partial [Reticulomyxa filosa]